MVTLYVLRGERGRRYVGITNDLNRRLHEHHSGSTIAGRLLGEFEVILTESFPDHTAARVREKYLKSGRGRKWLDEQEQRTGPAQGG
jgi:putative endonuclease